MKRKFPLAVTATLLASAMLTTACDEKKENAEESKMLLIQESYSDRTSGNKTIYEYDVNGNLLSKKCSSSDGYDNSETYTYDEAGRMLTHEESWGDYGMSTTYKYNTKGDTISVVEESVSEGNKEVTMKLAYEYNAQGVITHKYEYHAYMAEGEGIDYLHMIVNYEYDKQGRIATVTSCDLNYELLNDYPNLKIVKTAAGTPTEEYKRMLSDNTVTDPIVEKYTYDANNRLVETQGSEMSTKYSYDQNGHILKAATTYEGPYGFTSNATYTYDTEGRPVKKVQEYGEDYQDIEEVSYNANGDTILVINRCHTDGKTTVTGKEVRQYRQDGTLQAIYKFNSSDEWGHDMQSAEKESYDEQGLKSKAETYMSEGEYIEDLHISDEMKQNVDAEFQEFCKRNNMAKYSTRTYKFAKWISGKGIQAQETGKPADDKNEGIEYKTK